MADDIFPSVLQGLDQGFNALGEGLMWGGAAGNPEVMQGMLQMMQQRRGQNDARRRFLGESIIQSVQSGEVPWSEAQPALEKLGYPVKDMPNPFGTPGAATGNFYNLINQFYQGGASATASAGMQPSPLSPTPTPEAGGGVQTQGLPPQTGFNARDPDTGGVVPAGMENDPAYAGYKEPAKADALLSERANETGVTRTYQRTDGKQYTIFEDKNGVKHHTGGLDDALIQAMTPDERASYEGSAKVLSAPRPTQADLIRMMNASGVRSPKERERLLSHFQGLLKEDLDRRNNAIEQQKLAIDMAQKRLQEPKTLTVEEADPKDPEKADKVTYRFDPQHKRPGRRSPEDDDYVEIARAPRQPPLTVTQKMSPGDTEAQKLSAKRMIEQVAPQRIAYQKTKSQIRLAREILDTGAYTGTASSTREGLATFLSTFMPESFTPQMREEVARTGLLGKVTAGFLLNLVSAHIFQQRTTNMDVAFLNRVVPQLEQTPEAQKAILNMMDYYNEWDKRVLDEELAYYKKHGDIAGFEPSDMHEEDSFVRKGVVPGAMKDLIENPNKGKMKYDQLFGR